MTDNASDFRPMYARDQIHPGLAVMPAEFGRDRQQQLAGAMIDWIVSAAAEAGQAPADFMVNKLVAIEPNGTCTAQDLH